VPDPPVSDASPLIILAKAGYLDLLRLAGSSVLVPREVLRLMALRQVAQRSVPGDTIPPRPPGGVHLLVEELAADPMLPRQLGDGLGPDEGLDGQGLPLRRKQSLGRPRGEAGVGTEVRLRGIDERRSLAVHARFARAWSWDGQPRANNGVLGKPQFAQQLVTRL
jgi:hypothetical protein